MTQEARAAAVMASAGGGGANRGGGSKSGSGSGHWLWRARDRETGGWERECYELEKAPPPPPFIKALGSRWVIGQFRCNSEICLLHLEN